MDEVRVESPSLTLFEVALLCSKHTEKCGFWEQKSHDFSSTTTPRCFLFSLAALRSSFLCGAIGLFLAPQRNEERRETANQIDLRNF